MDDQVPNEENAAPLNKAGPAEVVSGQLETGTGPGSAFLNSSYPAALEWKPIQILFFSLLLTATVFALIAFILLCCFFHEQNKIAKQDLKWAVTPMAHEAVMILFGVIFQGFTILVYRIIPCCSINVLKYIHFGLHTLIGFFMLCGLVYVYFFTKLAYYNERFATNVHNATQHSWAGIVTLTCFMLQLAAGTFIFIPPMIPVQIRTLVLPIHKAIGWVIYLVTCTTALVGINNIERENENRYRLFGENPGQPWVQGVELAQKELLVRFAFLFLLFHILIMLYLGIAPQFQRRPRQV